MRCFLAVPARSGRELSLPRIDAVDGKPVRAVSGLLCLTYCLEVRTIKDVKMNKNMWMLAGLATAIAVPFASLADQHGLATEHGKLSTVQRVKHWLQTGQASWYGLKFQGHRTATGEKV